MFHWSLLVQRTFPNPYSHLFLCLSPPW
jgi:hypothetical protein